MPRHTVTLPAAAQQAQHDFDDDHFDFSPANGHGPPPTPAAPPAAAGEQMSDIAADVLAKLADPGPPPISAVPPAGAGEQMSDIAADVLDQLADPGPPPTPAVPPAAIHPAEANSVLWLLDLDM